MFKEIGSEFWDVPTKENPNLFFPASIQWFLCGRSALQAVIADIGKFRRVYLPSWCCDSMVKPFADIGIDIHFYPVFWQNGLIQEIASFGDVLFLMDYFGYSSSALDLVGNHGVIIRDVTHSVFSSVYSDSDYYFGSLRKWCGVWTGGYVWTRDGHKLDDGTPDESIFVDLRMRAMKKKREFIEGVRNDKVYLKDFDAAEDCLENAGIAPASDRDIYIARYLDVENIKKSRRSNAQILREAFPDWLIFPELKPADTPMFVPVIVPDGKRNGLRRFLIEHQIYCPVHWPLSKYHKLTDRERFLYDNELSLVCDQRYTEDDMRRMVKAIRLFIEE